MVSEVGNADKIAAVEAAADSGARAGQDLTVGPEYQHLLRLTGFMLLGFVAVMSANLIETLYIGNVGTQELAPWVYLSCGDGLAGHDDGIGDWRFLGCCKEYREW